jgi:acetylornithine deacetylase/succinyl-diaminopimelate desuccinylase-like protein
MTPYLTLDQDDAVSIEALREFVRLPSVAGSPAGLLAAADHAGQLLISLGFRVWQRGSSDAPVLFAELAGIDDHWLLFYNHYDVTDPGSEGDWLYPPFAAEISEGMVFGRGTSDHKASFMARIMAIQALLARGPLPIGIRFLIDSEEESGSPNLETILRNHGHELTAAGGLYSGGALDEKNQPVIRAGSKGMCSLQLTVRTARQPLHSKWAVLVPNPAWRLVAAFASMYDPSTNKVLVPGFHDSIEAITTIERAAISKLDFGIEQFEAAVEPASLVPASDSSGLLERIMFEPTFNIAYFSAGDGSRTVLPNQATAILDIRLVPWQDSSHIRESIAAHLSSNGFSDIQITSLGEGNPDKCDLADPVVQALQQASSRVYNVDVQTHPSGAGSGPRYLFRKYLGISLVQDPGASWLGSNDHAANENIRIGDYLANIRLIERFITEYASLVSR